MRRLKFNTNYHANDIKLSNNEIEKLFTFGQYNNLEQELDLIDVDIDHLEKIFTNETFYYAMKIVPLIERKVLYLYYVENIKTEDICTRLNLPKKKVIRLKNKAIIHFKNNLNTLYITQSLSKKGGS